MGGGAFKTLINSLIDFALPPRCAGCGTIVGEVHSFCSECWKAIDFLGDSGCSACGIPLEALDSELCGACLARPPRIERTRAAVAYDDLTRGLVLRLKYGRKVALARTMARYMSPLIGDNGSAILVPVPLHRTRLWQRGFNQAMLLAREVSRRTGIPVGDTILKRTKSTPRLKGLSTLQRRKVVAGAFSAGSTEKVQGRTVVLVDDVLTSGSTANACAEALMKAGAQSVELIAWTRVLRPVRIDQ